MQANHDSFERKQLLQVFGEPDYDSRLLSASKAGQKRKSSPATTKDRSDEKRVKSVKKTSPASKSKTIPQHKQCVQEVWVCKSRDREIHEAIPNVMAVLHENPDLQRGLLDAAADTTSTFSTYLDSFFLPPLSDSRFFLRHKEG
jgi:hypothetical protein